MPIIDDQGSSSAGPEVGQSSGPIPVLQPTGLQWVSIYTTPFAHEDMLTGIYLVRCNQTKQMASIEVTGPFWGSPFDFDEYAFVSPLMEGWKLIH